MPCTAIHPIWFESTRTLGEVWALAELWTGLGLLALRGIFAKTRRRIDVEALLRLMVFNRLCDPDSKLWGYCAGWKRSPCRGLSCPG